jgi:hypothetical protein
MGFFKKAKESFQEKQKERAEEKAELKRIYREELAKERGIQEAGRRLTAREDARDRARARARAPTLSARFATGAGRLASGTKSFIEKQGKQSGGVDFLGFGGSKGTGFGTDFFGMQPAKSKPRAKARVLSSRARQGQIVINVGAPTRARTIGKKKRRSKARSPPDFSGFF